MKKIYFNPDPCTGCMNCEAACFQHHYSFSGKNRARLKLELDPFTGINRMILCRQCRDAACASSCPREAIRFDPETAAWVIEYSECDECGICIEACPFGAMFTVNSKDTPVKCDLCGGDPECVRACRFGALFYEVEAGRRRRGIPIEDLDPELGRG